MPAPYQMKPTQPKPTSAPEPIPALRPKPMNATPLTGQPKAPGVPAPTNEAAQQVPGGILTSTAPQGTPAPTAVPAAAPVNRPPQGETFTAPPTAIPATGGQTPLTPTTLTPTDPNNPLTGQTITPGPGLDRFRIANQQYDQFIAGTDPAYQASLRDAKRVGAAAGGLGSGMLRTSIGDLANTRGNALQGERSKLFTDALLGSVDDARFATGVTQQQQGFQNEQQRDAFANELARLGLTDQLTNSDFQRDLQLWLAGQQGGTGSNTALTGANQAGNNAQDALAALQQWMAQRAARPGAVSPANPPSLSSSDITNSWGWL